MPVNTKRILNRNEVVQHAAGYLCTILDADDSHVNETMTLEEAIPLIRYTVRRHKDKAVIANEAGYLLYPLE